ncbi:unnamed protein product [Arctia plantaginis]|uniref:Peptidase S1 domain-containing protein n=1 Tax=Arctia plantaginis TaxID=874455 RepID=A0A8S1BR73_ARCPL|nr:unnamed protein product [Arctia plantaginis]
MWRCFCIYVIIVSSTAITRLSENELFPCSFLNGDQNLSPLRCQNGIDCIGLEHVCDGIRHCPDSRDETFCLLSNNRSKRSNACVLPAYPNHGIYRVSNNPQARPGETLDSLALTVYCRRGYGVVNRGSSSGNGTEVFCVNGVWYQNMPQCVRFCKLDPNPSVRYMCHVPGLGLKVCDNYVSPGTLVSPVCNTPIYYSTESFSKMKCTTGFWNYVAQCKAECGRVSPEAFQLVIDGKEAKRGELPWHVGVYRKAADTLEQICGGSLVSNNVVISAAHCFWSDTIKVLPASNYKVGIGKLYRSWDSKRDVGVQKSDVKQIKIPSLFQGAAANFQEDIAILILTTPFVYQTHVRPVCLNFDINFERWQLQQGNAGKIAGWGLTTANGNASPILKVVDMPFINAANCIKALPPSFREYITGDKFCAGYTNGTALCRGDSGGGLAFADRELGIDRYYLRGIVSTAPRNDDKMCNDNAYTTFTKITKHQEFINDALAESASRTCPFYSFQCLDGSCVDQGADCDGIEDCADGSDEANELCKATVDIIDGSPPSDVCVLPAYPNHGSYIVSNISNPKPGQHLETFLLRVSCSKGYNLATPGVGTILLDTEVYCSNGVWYQKYPKCIPADCEIEGKKGKCVPSNVCPLVPRGNLTKSEPPLCTSPSDKMPLICCTDYEVASDRVVLFFNPLLKISPKTGASKARDKCTEYMKTLDYTCGTDNSIQVNGKPIDQHRLCYIKNRRQPGGELNSALRSASRGEFPHMASLGYGETIDTASWECGGSIISERFILTSAHCLFYPELGPVKYIALGVLRRADPYGNWQRYNVKRSIVRSNYNPSLGYHNIGLVETDRPIAFSSSVLPACIHGEEKTVDYEYLPGFGVLVDPILRHDILQSVLKVRFEGKYSSQNPPQVPMQKPNQGSIMDAVQSQNNGQCPFLLLGLFSHPVDCNVNGNQTIVTEIKYYIDWIENVVWP